MSGTPPTTRNRKYNYSTLLSCTSTTNSLRPGPDLLIPQDWTGASLSRLYFARDDNHTHNDDDRSDSEEDAGGNPKTFKRVCTRFAERTSMQGIPYVHVSTAVYAKVAWSIIFTVGLLAMVAHLYLLFSDYYSSV